MDFVSIMQLAIRIVLHTMCLQISGSPDTMVRGHVPVEPIKEGLQHPMRGSCSSGIKLSWNTRKNNSLGGVVNFPHCNARSSSSSVAGLLTEGTCPSLIEMLSGW